MKKKISILLIVFVLALSFAGCGKSEKTTATYNQTELEQYTETLIQSFSQMTDPDFQSFQDSSDLELNLMLMQSGLPVEGKDFLTMIGSWQAAVTECGAYVDHGEYKVEASAKEIVVSTEAQFEEKAADIIFIFDEKINMESMTVNTHYTTEEILKKAGLNTVLGMGTVFVVLIFISFIISLFRFIPALEKKWGKKSAVPVSTPAPASLAAPAEVPEDGTDDFELTAVIAAAIAASEGTSTDGFIVRSIKRRNTNKWN